MGACATGVETTITYRVSDGALEVHTRLDNLSTEQRQEKALADYRAQRHAGRFSNPYRYDVELAKWRTVRFLKLLKLGFHPI
jgi:hypothetical protein